MAIVSGDESISSASDRHFEERQIVRVGKLDRKRLREDHFPAPLDALHHHSNIFCREGEPRPRENLAIFGEDSIVVQRYGIPLEEQAKHLGRGTVG